MAVTDYAAEYEAMRHEAARAVTTHFAWLAWWWDRGYDPAPQNLEEFTARRRELEAEAEKGKKT